MSEQIWIFLIGMLAATVSYFANHFVFQPILELNQIKSKIQNRLKYYANVITNSGLPTEMTKDVRPALRQLGCDLEEKYTNIALRRIFIKLKLIPSPIVIRDVAKDLIYLSNAANSRGNELKNNDVCENIKNKLGLI